MSSYRKGRRLEYTVRDMMRKGGWTVFRCAASKPVDLVCLKKGKAPLIIECKHGSSKPSKKTAERLRKLAELTGATPVFASTVKPGEITLHIIDSAEKP